MTNDLYDSKIVVESSAELVNDMQVIIIGRAERDVDR